MLPVLFTIGAFSLKTLNLFIFLAVLISGFVFWRFGREEHYREDQLFDGFISSFFFGFLTARLAHVAVNFGNYGWNLIKWLDVWSDPGFNLLAGFVGAIVFLYKFAKAQKWDEYAIVDLWLPAILVGGVLIKIGQFFDQRLEPVFGLDEWWASRHLLMTLLLVVFSLYLRNVEYKYRTFAWYKRHRQVAQTGFIFGMGLSLVGFSLLLTQLLFDAPTFAQAQWLAYVQPLGLIVFGIIILLVRAGHFHFRLKKKQHLSG